MTIQKKSKITKAHFRDARETAYNLLDQLDSSIIYHRKEHTTESVVPAALILAHAEGLSLEDKLLIGIAAAFHDTGFTKQYNSNEPVGAELAEEYLKASSFSYSEEHVQNIKDAINNTNMKNPPKTKYEKILRDADLSYIGTSENFLQWNSDLMKEANIHTESPLHDASQAEEKWGKSALGFVSQFHNWFTDSAKTLYTETKKENIIKLKEYYKI